MENIYLVAICIFSISAALVLRYYFIQYRNLLKNEGKILSQKNLEKYHKKNLYLKLVTIINEVQFDFRNQKINVYGFQIGSITLEKGFIPEIGKEDSIGGKVFFDLSSSAFRDEIPQEGYIYKVKKFETGLTLEKKIYLLEAENYLSNVPNAGQKTS